ncbi:MAG: glycine--tRNA ligase [Candidatus Micrarchaeota archaeon]
MFHAGRMEKVTSLLARRGFVFPSGDIYGSLAGFYDYGHYGVQLKRNIERSWWEFFVQKREDIVGMDGSIISSSAIWNASGHLKEFTDPLIECNNCHGRFRADQLVEDELKLSVEGLSLDAINALIKEHKLKCEKCKGDLEIAKPFNLMFKTHVGASEDERAIAYLRPETAQMIFTNFKQVQLTSRKQLPFGIAQSGKAFRNEISPRNFLFRVREFSQMELEYFINSQKMDVCAFLEKEDLSLEIIVLTAAMQDKKQTEGRKFAFKELVEKKVIGNKWHAYLVLLSYGWFLLIGIKPENLRIREHVKQELSHYSQETWDIEYRYPWGWKEIAGIANRTDYDLKQHMVESKKDLSYFDEESKAKIIPFVIEPSFGLERAFLTAVFDAYEEKIEVKEPREKQESGEAKPGGNSENSKPVEEKKNILHLSPAISPVQVAVFPLMKKDGLAEKAREIFAALKAKFACEYDESGSIGRRYARQDEIGTPYCITIDYDTLKDNAVTIRERDFAKQKRVNLDEIILVLDGLLRGAQF